MKFNDAYSQMFPGYPDAVSLQQTAEMLGLNRHTVGEILPGAWILPCAYCPGRSDLWRST